MSKKLVTSFAIVVAAIVGILLVSGQRAVADRASGVSCVMDVMVGSEIYHKEFVLQEGETFFDDFSTRIRFKYFTASLEKINGESKISVNWYADVSVFDSVDFNTSVTLANGQKSGKVAGDHTLYTSNNKATTTHFSLSCVEN
jgi:hypothetical protein